MSEKTSIPEELFHAVAALIPRLVSVAEHECEIQPVELLTLWHIRRFGKSNSTGQPLCLRSELTGMLGRRFRFSEPSVSKLLEELQDRELIIRTSITARQRLDLFGGKGGPKLVVILLPKGSDKIDEFIERIQKHGERWISGQPYRYRQAAASFAPIAIQVAKLLIGRYGTSESGD